MINQQLADYVKKVRAQGYSDRQITSFLSNYGYDNQTITEVLSNENNPSIPGVVKEAPNNYAAKSLGTNDGFKLPGAIRASSIISYVVALSVLIIPIIFTNQFFILTGALKWIFLTFTSLLGLSLFYSGYLISKPNANSKKISTIIHSILVLFIVIMFFKKTLDLDIVGMIIYFVFLILDLYIIYVLFDKKFSEYFQ